MQMIYLYGICTTDEHIQKTQIHMQKPYMCTYGVNNVLNNCTYLQFAPHSQVL